MDRCLNSCDCCADAEELRDALGEVLRFLCKAGLHERQGEERTRLIETYEPLIAPATSRENR